MTRPWSLGRFGRNPSYCVPNNRAGSIGVGAYGVGRAVTEVARDIGAAGFVDAVDNALRHGERARVGRCGWTTRGSHAIGSLFVETLGLSAIE
jgi:hypothetical protein